MYPFEFRDLPRELRTVALVGSYLQFFACMESQLNEAMRAALGLTTLQSIMVCKNMQLRDKIHLLKSATNLLLSDTEAEPHVKTLVSIAKLTNDRNTVAHEFFFADPDGDGVQFLVVKAKSEVTFPPARWSVDDFESKFDTLMTRMHELENLTARLRQESHRYYDTQIAETMNELRRQVLQGPPSHPLQSRPEPHQEANGQKGD